MSADDTRVLSAETAEDELREHAAAIGDEFLAGFEAVARIDRPAVSIFGSARVHEGSPAYDWARVAAHRFARRGGRSSRAAGPA